MTTQEKLCQTGLDVINQEAQAIQALTAHINEDFAKACHLLLACQGRVITTGMGKSGHIARKLSATLSSTGTPSFFLHTAEASHGDMGMITPDDAIILLSNSGETAEALTLLPLFKRLGVPIIALTGNPQSTIANRADIHLSTAVDQEACPLGLAPTTSSTAALVMSDALAITLLTHKSFSAEDFAFSHPGGHLGRQLLLTVDTIMRKDGNIPIVAESTPLPKALLEMSRKSLGLTAIINNNGQLSGVFTDGDLRRALEQGIDIQTAIVSDVMTHNPKTIPMGTLAAEALYLMQTNQITVLLVVDAENKPNAVVHMYDLLRAGIV